MCRAAHPCLAFALIPLNTNPGQGRTEHAGSSSLRPQVVIDKCTGSTGIVTYYTGDPTCTLLPQQLGSCSCQTCEGQVLHTLYDGPFYFSSPTAAVKGHYKDGGDDCVKAVEGIL
eukprot:gene3765-700_t